MMDDDVFWLGARALVSAEQIIEDIRQLCALAGIEFESFLFEVFAC